MFWTGRSCPPSTGSFRGRSRRPAAPWSAKGRRQGSNATGWGAGGAIIWKRRRSWWTAAKAKGNERNISSFSAAPASRKTWKDSPENAETCCYGNNRALSPREQGGRSQENWGSYPEFSWHEGWEEFNRGAVPLFLFVPIIFWLK